MFNKKVLCLGTNNYDTDNRTSVLAQNNNTVNHGLISDSDFDPTEFGFYHTTVIDLPSGAIIKIAKKFDTVMLFDQPVEEWSHWKLLLSTYKIMVELESQSLDTVYKNNKNISKYKFFDTMLIENKSFCIYPWINLIEKNGNLTLCARSDTKITTLNDLDNWQTDPEYTKIRQQMLEGKLLPDYCSFCYNYESKGVESYRTFETKEWISKLNINSVEDLHNITQPYYHEVRLTNKCNLKCRSCKPAHSHLIEKEFKKFNIVATDPRPTKYTKLDYIDINTLNPNTRVYLTGGEPTIIAEVLTFMKQCIALGKTDFDFTLGTNGVKLSPTFLELSSQFTNMNFSISLDGYGKINDYWRSGSDWETVIKNTHILESQGHTISINCVPGIYNVTNLHLLFEFLDKEFPHCGMYLQLNHEPTQSAFNHPNSALVVDSMKRCQQTNTYHADGKSNRTCIDQLHDYYANNPTCDINALREFFKYNDRLDEVRNIKLKDYIPELEACRYLINNG